MLILGNLFLFFSVLPCLTFSFQLNDFPNVETQFLTKYSDYFLNVYELVDHSQTDVSFTAIVQHMGESLFFKKEDNPIIKNLKLIIKYESEKMLTLKIIDANNTRFEIPDKEPFPKGDSQKFTISHKDDSEFSVSITRRPFAITIIRRSTKEVIFDTKNTVLIYSDRYIELQSKIPTNFLIGMGERNYKTKLERGVYTLWSRDIVKDIEDGLGGHNTYGVHPVYLMKEKSGKFHMAFLRNSNAMDFTVGDGSINYKIIGGIIDFKFFLGSENPESCVKDYHRYLKGAMGYHQSRWGYKNLSHVEDILFRYNDLDLPFDSFFFDLDYMENKNLFSVNDTSFHKKILRRFIRRSGKKVVALIDVGMGINFTNSAFTKGFAENIYIKNYKGENLKGWVWPGAVFYPDFLHPRAQNYWNEIFEEFHQDFPFSGVWLDMNEISNFCNAECVDQTLENLIPQYPYSRYFIPYAPGFLDLENKTLSLFSFHYGNLKEYDIHSLNSLMHAHATYQAMKKIKKTMPFIVTRGTFPGSGRYAAHWTGDNDSTWLFLQLSIPSLFQFNIYGVPMVGADICGFMGNTTEELCARWIQVGALYPLSRNHNHEASLDQELDTLGPTLIHTARVNLKFRYSILKYYYSLMIENAEVGTLIKPLFFIWSEDDNLYRDDILDTHFMIGESLLAIPHLTNETNFTAGYLPKSTWYHFHTHRKFVGNGFFTLWYIPLNQTIPMFIKEGAVVPVQDVASVRSSADLDNVYDLLVTLKEKKIDSLGILNETSTELSQSNESSPKRYYSEGIILSLEKLGEENVLSNCVEKNYSCLYKIDVQAEIIDQELRIAAMFTHMNSKFDEDTNNEEVLIRDITFLGLQSRVDHLFQHDEIKATFKKEGKKWSKKVKLKKRYFEPHHGDELKLTLKNMNVSVYHNLEISFTTDPKTRDNFLNSVASNLFALFIFFYVLIFLRNLFSVNKSVSE